ncbi:hypothetical protein C0V72_09065 [Porphyrobacter sp. TH134]|nr:hypothetical protein C0V72_09065 [Porphyrobacter sp. TH134]
MAGSADCDPKPVPHYLSVERRVLTDATDSPGQNGHFATHNDLGCSVPGEGSDTSAADRVAEQIRKDGGKACANHDSVATSEGVRRIVEAALERFGRVDALVNSAGTMRFGPFEEMEPADFAAVIETHLVGSFNIASAVWPHMKVQGHGRILLTASAAGVFGNRQMASYAAAKSGVVGLSNVLALEGEPHGIACNALLPTAVSKMADFVGGTAMSAPPIRSPNASPATWNRNMPPALPSGLPVRPARATGRPIRRWAQGVPGFFSV